MQIRFYVSCFVVRAAGNSHEFLQIRRAPGKFMADTWQLVCGGIESGESAVQAALRELREETCLTPIEFYQVDVVNTFYLATADSIMHSPMFCAIVATDAKVCLNAEHTDFRWIGREDFQSKIMWPGERAAFAELCREILDNGGAKPHLRLYL